MGKKILIIMVLLAVAAMAQFSVKGDTWINVYDVYGTKGKIVDTIPSDTKTWCMGQWGIWCKILVLSNSVNEGKRGWIPSSLVSEDWPPVALSNYTLKKGADLTAKDKCSVEKGAFLEVLYREIIMYEVMYVLDDETNTGWVFSEKVR